MMIAEDVPSSVRHLLGATDLCERDLFAMLRELEAADVVDRSGATYTTTFGDA